MNTQRSKYMFYNSTASLIQQIITLVCGLILPRLILGTYGSAANGTVSSITQFISITSLLQGGISSATRVAFYRPVALNNKNEISIVYRTSREYYKKFSIFLLCYIFALAIIYPRIFQTSFSYYDTFLLVVIIGIGTLIDYMLGITNQILLFASQKGYINTLLQAFCTFVSSVVSIILIELDCSLILVKAAAGCVLIIRPLVLKYIVSKGRIIDASVSPDKRVLNQSNAALAKSIAFYVHTSTDAILITAFLSPIWVSVYAVHRLVVNSISQIVTGILSNTEVVFGNIIACEDQRALDKEFPFYDLLTKMLSANLFFTTMILISGFVNIYTNNVNDVSYYHPIFAIIYCASEMVYTMSLTYHNMIMAAGHIKQTKWISIWEALINITISILLIVKMGIVGVAIGTFIAFLFNSIANAWYVKHHIYNFNANFVLKNYLVNIVSGICAFIIVVKFINYVPTSFIQFFMYAPIILIVVVVINCLFNFIFFKQYFLLVVSFILEKIMKKITK